MKYIDLFSGCGGLSLGLEKAGFELALAVEKSPMAAETFHHNLIGRIGSKTEWDNYLQLSIDEQFDNKLIVNEVKAVLENEYIMDCLENEGIDLIAGGPPCQGFSMAGRRNPKDIRNQLPWQFLEMVERIHPKAVLIENVLGIKHNFEKHREKAPIEEINSVLQEMWPGYVTLLMEVNAAHFGVPQHRPRVMVIALRADIAQKLKIVSWNGFWKSSFLSEEFNVGYKQPALAPICRVKEALTVRHALWDLKQGRYAATSLDDQYNSSAGAYAKQMRSDKTWLPLASKTFGYEGEAENQTLRNHSEQISSRFRLYQLFQQFDLPPKIFNTAADQTINSVERNRLIKSALMKIVYPARSPDGTMIAKTVEELLEKVLSLSTKKHSQRPLRLAFPSPTVLSMPDDFVHPLEPRTMTVREMARLQSFPDNFVFRAKETTGSLRRRFEVPQYTQVGNAVPPLLAFSVGQRISELIETALTPSLSVKVKKTLQRARVS